ncbi:MAG: hypothetical protein DKM50_07305 [Candidatus Margulisiibacteriota bacterium]|nr:MAG: hypothetical protein A2X42_01370 [Candidatus Margulisbacteria bacterium GWF2_38_17]OGI10477.1 MAG: hypothetical protein A2X41_06870 [Candidatus Margulisbacteria bacterium GWE2_39_32]PZM79977.1 MAG: hypothetical protein DKM50_07305 [Candidatus Margulisiibacteriota bacterium]HCT84412.1 hypothetical protein [Candidatus Margulisiibacteriota bacterium]HCY37227.1 hypothetical protein [Candidatus Margulisiibacteriota bacterium]
MESDHLHNIVKVLEGNDITKISEALTFIIFSNPAIDSKLLLNLLNHSLPEISLGAFQALGSYNGIFNEQIIEELKENDDQIKQAMLIAALSVQPTEASIAYFVECLSAQDEVLQSVALEILTNYQELSLIPLLTKTLTATEHELIAIKTVFEKIGTTKVFELLKQTPFEAILENLKKIYSEDELKQLSVSSINPL